MAPPIAGIVFDIDGTILRGSRMLPAACETIQQLRTRQLKLCFFTNDNRVSIDHWLKRLHAHDIAVQAGEILTSASVVAETVARLHPMGSVLAVGDVGLREALQAHGLQLIDWDSAGVGADSAEIVVMGKDPHFDQKRLDIVCQHIWNGAKFYATNNDRKMPVADGYIPATGAMVQAVAYATGVEPIVTGKPSKYAAKVVLERVGVSAENIAIVGDSLTSDIALGKIAGIRTILVLTGTHGRDDVQKLSPADQPDHIINDLSDLPSILFGETV